MELDFTIVPPSETVGGEGVIEISVSDGDTYSIIRIPLEELKEALDELR